MVPGHEIVGRVVKVGAEVRKLKAGDLAGRGCMVDSCRQCSACKEDLEQYCEKGATWTYNGKERESGQLTFGGYSEQIVVEERFVVKIPENLDLKAVAPLLCAGITTWSAAAPLESRRRPESGRDRAWRPGSHGGEIRQGAGR